MTDELTSEQIVTKLLEKNAILQPEKNTYSSIPWADLGEYLTNYANLENHFKQQKYSFIQNSETFF